MENNSLKKISSVWVLAILIVFMVAVTFGIIMRFSQGRDFNIAPNTFYSLMTAHGVTMIGLWTVAGFVAVHYLMQRYVSVSKGLNVFAFVATVVGLLLLWASTLIADFHAGWTFLYPLPFHMAWAEWGTLVFLISLTVFGATWLIWAIGMLASIFKKYSLSQAFAWQHFKKEPKVETPPLILIASVSLIGIIVSLIAAVILLVLFYIEYFSKGAIKSDPLLMKNLTYFFGHTVANEALYLGLATLYELLPEVSGRPKFKATWYVALAWNCTLVFVLTAFFHHLYMDFVQPLGFQMIGQLASYFASLPSAAVTVFSIMVMIWGNKIKWNLTNLLFFVGVAGWMIGGVGALIDATISNNIILHNTLWVPAHFHTYNAMGNVLFSLAFFYWFAKSVSGTLNIEDRNNTMLLLILIIGGAGLVLMFYLGGAESVPRRFSDYPTEFKNASLLASIAAWFAIVYLIFVLLFFFKIIKNCLKAF
ncbi:MAG TPA: cbb3-type cytochrome c oxidase subunit I [Edaphocola sp.]|nr:cbb3-type cytochrome c oxidase subunit I [Edaphocola sp.]